MIGISVADGGFELICGDARIGGRGYLDEAGVERLEGFASRYAQLLERADPSAELLTLGRDLYRFLDGEGRDLTTLIDRSQRPLHFEIAAAARRPSTAELALLRAPWELLANGDGFIAADVNLGFSAVRRLGRPEVPAALDQYRLGLAFMAASPRGAVELDYEAEETAIMQAVGTAELDLLVEESGNPDELGERIVEVPAMQALHLSCHGANDWRRAGRPEADAEPVLLLEDEAGDALPTEAGTLIEALRAQRPRFVFLSACLSAAAGERRDGWRGDKRPEDRPQRSGVVAQSLAEALVDGGVPAVLGWDGSVRDIAATAFAATLYDGLAGRKSLADAVAAARRTLLNAPEDARRRDWHLARLWLGPQGGGAIVGGKTRRAMMPATHGEKEFLIKQRQKVPVASHEMFVGRRRELQVALRALRDGQYAGVLLHGMGRLGKSSLAARVANRRRDLKLAVVFEHYGALDVLAALEEALRQHRAASDAIREAARRVREDASRLEQELTWLLSGPCAQAGDGGAPLLLVIDDLERILPWDADRQQYVVSSSAAPVLRAVLRAFDPATTESRLIITSRFPFRLEDLEAGLFDLPLPPLSPAAQHKLELRQRTAVLSGRSERERTEDARLVAERDRLLARVAGIARGNPGLQDLIGRKLVLSKAVTVEHAAQALNEMEAWLAQGELPSDAEVRAFLKNLAIDDLIGLAGESGRELLRGLTLFDLPVPELVAEKVARMVEGSLPHLRDLGLIDVHEDPVDHRKPAVAANALAAARIAPLSDAERRAVAREVAHDLFTTWGGIAAAPDWPLTCDLELTRLGLLAEDAEIVATCGAAAVREMSRGPAKEATELGRAAIQLLDAQKRVVPWRLLWESAQAAATSGDGQAADALLARGMQALARQQTAGGAVDAMGAALLLSAHADRLATRGDLDEALRINKEELLPAFERLGDVRSRAITMGRIAKILVGRGDLDEALRISTEEELPVYERLGEVRSRAIAMGRIADIHVSRGDLDEALRVLREELLPAFERLGDVRSRAVTMGNIADILFDRGDLDQALRIHKEELLPAFERLGDVRSRAVTMGRIADILFRRGELDEALRIHQQEELPVYQRLGDVRERAITMGNIADILFRRGELDQALRIHQQEELPVYERLGEVRSRAIAMAKIADILFRRGELDEALRINKEELLPAFERLGDVRARAVTMGNIADILFDRGDLDEALRIRKEEQLPVYKRLGDVRARAVTMGKIADILFRCGELDEALRIRQQEELPVYERLGDISSRAVTMGKIADILFRRGELDEALRIRKEEQLPVYERLGDVRERAITLGQIADILVRRGDLDEALRIRKEEQLPVYERLGDARSCAATMFQIANILFRRGDLDEARTLLDERLEVNRRLGDADGIASAQWGLAQLDLAQGKTDAARPRLVEAYDILRRLGLANGVAVVGMAWGQILAAGDKRGDALAVLRRSAEMFRKLGREESARQAEELIAQLGLG